MDDKTAPTTQSTPQYSPHYSLCICFSHFYNNIRKLDLQCLQQQEHQQHQQLAADCNLDILEWIDFILRDIRRFF